MKNITFENAISYTEELLLRNDLDATQLESEISTLVQTENGARGFFVCFLTGDWQLADAPSLGVINALKSAPDVIAELLVKNLAMSTAMALVHKRMGNEEQSQSSMRVAQRTTLLIEKVDLAEVRIIMQQMQKAANANTGEYSAFLKKWGYDSEQKQAISNALT